jgi:hypothetical protein
MRRVEREVRLSRGRSLAEYKAWVKV